MTYLLIFIKAMFKKHAIHVPRIGSIRGIVCIGCLLISSSCFAVISGTHLIHTQYQSPLLSDNVTVDVYCAGSAAPASGSKGLVYIKNLPIKRIGKESDESIINDYISKGWVVSVVDYKFNPKAISPQIEVELDDLNRHYFGSNGSPLWTGKKEFCPQRSWVVVAGYRIETDLPFFDVAQHANANVLEFVKWSYNHDVCGANPDMVPVNNALEIKAPKGEELRWKQCMDVIYASQPEENTPHINDNGYDASRLQTQWLIGFMIRGCSISMTDHNYNPVWLSYFKWAHDFTLDKYCGVHAARAAVRFLYANPRFHIDTAHIGFTGMSKAQFGVTVLSNPNNSKTDELLSFGGDPSPWPPQPNEGFPTQICVGYQGSGLGLFQPKLVTPDYVPTFISQGELDQKGVVSQFHVFCNSLNSNHVAHHFDLSMPGIGHSMPKGFNDELKRDNYELFVEFMDQYLHAPPLWPLVSTETRLSAGGVTLIGAAKAGDTPVVSYHWEKLKGPDLSLTGADSKDLILHSPPAGDYAFCLTATDQAGRKGYSVATFSFPAK